LIYGLIWQERFSESAPQDRIHPYAFCGLHNNVVGVGRNQQYDQVASMTSMERSMPRVTDGTVTARLFCGRHLLPVAPHDSKATGRNARKESKIALVMVRNAEVLSFRSKERSANSIPQTATTAVVAATTKLLMGFGDRCGGTE